MCAMQEMQGLHLHWLKDFSSFLETSNLQYRLPARQCYIWFCFTVFFFSFFLVFLPFIYFNTSFTFVFVRCEYLYKKVQITRRTVIFDKNFLKKKRKKVKRLCMF